MIPFSILVGAVKVRHLFRVFNLTDGHFGIFIDRANFRRILYEFHYAVGQ